MPYLLVLLLLAAPGLAAERSLLLEGFETAADLARWTLTSARVERVADGATQGETALRVSTQPVPAGQDGWPAIKWTHSAAAPYPATDWSGYDALAFDIRNLDAEELPLRLRLDDAAEHRWTKEQTVAAGATVSVEIPIGAFGGGLDPAQMRHIDFFFSSPREPHAFILDNLRLVARELTLQTDEARDDPFGRGRARLRATLSRAVPWRIDIVDAAGAVVRSEAGEGAAIDWRWDGRDAQGLALPAGRYTARLTTTEPLFDGQTATRDWLPIALRDDAPAWLIWPAGSGEKVFLDDYPRRSLDGPLSLHLVRNEVEALQFVIQAGRDLDNVHVAIEGLARDGGVGGALPEVTVHQVGYVDCGEPPYAVSRNGWWPDPLLPVDTFDVPAGDAQPVWLSWRTAADTQPGVYRGEVVVSADGAEAQRVPLELTVHDITLPVSTRMRTAFSTYDQFIAKMHGGASDEMMMKYWTFIADHRINPDNIYRKEPPRIEVLEHFHERGQLNAFCIRTIPGRTERYTDEQKAELAAQLDPFMAELRRRPELLKLGYFYGYDEVKPESFESMRDIFGWLKQRYPEVPTMTTAYDHSFGTKTGLNDVVDIWVPLTPRYDRDLARQVREQGGDVWWYTCIGPRHPYANWFIEYEALEARLIWWQAYAAGSTGHLYYTMTRWPLSEHPIDPSKGARTDWPAASYKTANGDGSLFCAGPDGPLTTIRFENVRDGLEDMELLAMLDELRTGREAAAPAGAELVERLSPSLTDYTRDTDELLAVRREVMEAIERLAAGR